MTILRRQFLHAVRNLPCLRTPVLVLCLATAASLGAVAAPLAGTHTRVHHPGVIPLPASSYTETSTTRAPKKHGVPSTRGGSSAAGHASSASHPGAGGSKAARSGKGGQRRRGRVAQSEPAVDPVPMLRTAHPAGRWSLKDRRALARAEASPRRLGRSTHNVGGPILVDRRGRPVLRARFAAMRSFAPAPRWAPTLPPHWSSAPDRAIAHTASAIAASTAATRHSGASTGDLLAAAQRSSSNPAEFADSHAGAFTEGISSPDAEDRDPDHRDPRSGAASAAASVGTAVVLTPNAAHPQPPNAVMRGQVVEGFGSEVALAPNDPNVRTAASRRRDHPVASAALPGFAPLPLAERDAITEAAVSPAVLPDIYDRNGRLMMPAPLRGSREILVHQNTMADSEGLERIHDDGELDQLRASHALVSFPVSGSLRVNEDLAYNRRCARPWTVQFTTDIARDFYERFHQSIQVNSAVRTVSYQARLQRINGNAAAIDGDAASPHLTGQAIDLGKRGMSASELAWMRAYLMPLMSAGKIDVEEEFHQACFHISVYRRYAGGRLPGHQVAQSRPSPAPALATDLQDQP